MTLVERKTVMEIESIVDDIHRITEGVPSGYAVPANELEAARSLLRQNPRKSLRQVERARELYRQESEIVAMYGRISAAVSVSAEPEAADLDRRYHEAILVGDYRTARKAVRRLTQILDVRELEPLRVSSFGLSAGGCAFTITSSTDSTVVVTGLRVSAGDSRLVTDPLPSFVMQPMGTRRVLCKSEAPSQCDEVTVVMEYEYSGRSRTAVAVFRAGA